MKDLIVSNPLLLAPIGAIAVVYFFITYQIARQKKYAAALEKGFIVAILFTLPGVTLPPFSTLHPASLLALEKSFASAAVQIGFYVSILLILRIHIREIFQTTLFLFRQGFLGLFLGFLLLSFVWSSHPLMTLRSSVVLIGLSITAAYIGKKYDWTELGPLILWNMAITVVGSLFLAVLVPSIGIMQEENGKVGWVGVLQHPLHLGSVMALGAALWFLHAVNSPKQRQISVLLFVVQFLVMQFANSAGAFVCCLIVISICLIPSLFKRLSFEQVVVFFSLILLVGATLIGGILFNFQAIITSLGRDITLTGRIPLWQTIFSVIKQPLWIGYGYDGFWQPWLINDWAAGKLNIGNPAYPVQRIVGIWAVHAHNGFLDIYLALGLIGLTLFLLSFFSNFVRAVMYVSQNNLATRFIPLALLVFTLVANLTESQLLITRYVWFYYVLLTVRLGINASNHKLSAIESLQP